MTDTGDEVVQTLAAMNVLLLDEVSMIDDEFWSGIEKTLSTLHSARAPAKTSAKKRIDHLGEVP